MRRCSLSRLLIRSILNPSPPPLQIFKEFKFEDAGFGFRQFSTGQSGARSKYSFTQEGKDYKKRGRITDLRSKSENEDLEPRHVEDEKPQANRVGKNISSTEKKKFLVNTLLDLKESKDVVYGTLDAWVAWEQEFPLALLKRAIQDLEKEQQWHKIVQVIKWMLSKGQGTTMRTYEQLIRALEKDGRPEEAHNIWVKKIGYDLHSVPWSFCDLMLSVYYRNDMLERLVKLFKELVENGRVPPYKSIVSKVEVAYELLGLHDEKKKLLEKYAHLFKTSSDDHLGKSQKDKKKAAKKKTNVAHASNPVQADSAEVDSEQMMMLHSSEGESA